MHSPPIDTTSYRSPNYNQRPANLRVEALVIHTTEGAWPFDIRWLCDRQSSVSAHYVISPDGQIYALVDDDKRAWHAGESFYAGRRDWNSFSLGIEISHLASHAYGPAQLPALTALCRALIARYGIEMGMVVPHRWVAFPAGRKTEPSNWPDTEFRAWVRLLYVPSDPLHTHTIAGANGTARFCGVGFFDFYASRGGLGMFGYALSDETPSTDLHGHAVTVMRLERAIFKYVEGVGVHLALLDEARALGWLP